MGPERFKPFDLQSISAGIRRIKNRIATLEQAAQEETKEIEFSDGIILDNVEENRVQIIFNSIPSQETREQLKKNGFRWSRRNRHKETTTKHSLVPFPKKKSPLKTLQRFKRKLYSTSKKIRSEV